MSIEPRTRLKRLLSGSDCRQLPVVFDPISARAAESLGFESAVFAGSIASATILGAPDLVVITASELADQVRRTTRAAPLPIIADSDHGYGNALNVMRTVEELENAGASGLTIEDTVLPGQFGNATKGMIGIDEMVGKLRAGLAARRDPSLSILARTSLSLHSGEEETAGRLKAYENAGVDAFYLVRVSSKVQIQAIRKMTSLPLIASGLPAAERSDLKALAALGVRMVSTGTQPFYAGVKAVYDTMKHLRDGGQVSDIKDKLPSQDLLDLLLRRKDYAQWQEEYLGTAGKVDSGSQS